MLSRRRALSAIAAPALLLPSKSLAFLLGTDAHPPGVGSPLDGAAAAPPGTVQYPTLLNTYGGFNARRLNQPNFQPTWRVAGVDYHVGPSSAVTLTPIVNGAGALNPGFPGTLSNFQVVANASALVSGWDFSVNNGYSLQVQGAVNITNCKFVVGSNLPGNQTPIIGINSVTSFTMTNCLVDGNAVDTPGNAGQIVQANGVTPGATLLQYNHLRNAWGECFQFGMNGSASSLTFKYNIIENAGLGVRVPAEGTHGDWAQIYSGSAIPLSQLTTAICSYNLFWQNITPISQAQTQGWNWMCASTNAAYYQTMDMSNNTAITASGAGVNAMLMANTTWLGTPSVNGTGTAFNNYVGFAGGQTDFGSTQWGFFGQNNSGPGGGRTTLVQLHGNIDMDTGGAAPAPDGAGWVNV